jgi:hypothetical protein
MDDGDFLHDDWKIDYWDTDHVADANKKVDGE